MKKANVVIRSLQALIFLSVALVLSGCAGNKIMTKQYTPDHILHYSKLQGMDENLNPNDYVLYIDKGESFPSWSKSLKI
jgi:hypothetical protein